jgi:hypothetical protein
MKTRLLLAAIMILGVTVFTYGQEEKNNEMKTIFGNTDHKVSHGGYAAITVGYTQIDKVDAFTLGGRAAWVIDHHVALGLAGQGFINSIYLQGYWDQISQGQGYYLVGGYGGFFVEPIVAPNFPIHVSFPIMIGGGGLALNDYTWHDYNWDHDNYNPYDYDYYFVLEPGVELELNVEKFLRMAFGISYRFTSDLHMNYVPKDMMNGFNATVTFKFGKF